MMALAAIKDESGAEAVAKHLKDIFTRSWLQRPARHGAGGCEGRRPLT